MNKIVNKLNKVSNDRLELSREVVELAEIKDLSKKLKQLFQSQKKLDKSLPLLKKVKEEVEVERRYIKLTIKESEDVLSDITKKAKALGVDPNDFPDFKSLSIEASNSKEYLK